MAATLVRDLTLATPVVRTVDGVSMSPDSSDVKLNAIRASAQTLTPEQKAIARSNIGAGTGTVSSISVNGGQKATPDASGNVNLTISAGGAGSDTAAVHYFEEEKNATEKTAARKNIGLGQGGILSEITLDMDDTDANRFAAIAKALEKLGMNIINKTWALILCSLLSFTCFGAGFDPGTCNKGNLRDSSIVVTNAVQATEGKYALFVIPMNELATTTNIVCDCCKSNLHHWTSIELKASTNNFENAQMVFYCTSDEADKYDENVWEEIEPGIRSPDGMLLFVASSVLNPNREARTWTQIDTTIDLADYVPNSLVCIVAKEMLHKDSDGRWLSSFNDDLNWVYLRIAVDGIERDVNGAPLWHPIMPAKWLRKLPAWAKLK